MIIQMLSFQLSISRKDRTKTGHALGEPGSRSTHAEPQRDMPPIVCSLLRIIMHSAMVMGGSRNPQVIVRHSGWLSENEHSGDFFYPLNAITRHCPSL